MTKYYDLRCLYCKVPTELFVTEKTVIIDGITNLSYSENCTTCGSLLYGNIRPVP